MQKNYIFKSMPLGHYLQFVEAKQTSNTPSEANYLQPMYTSSLPCMVLELNREHSVPLMGHCWGHRRSYHFQQGRKNSPEKKNKQTRAFQEGAACEVFSHVESGLSPLLPWPLSYAQLQLSRSWEGSIPCREIHRDLSPTSGSSHHYRNKDTITTKFGETLRVAIYKLILFCFVLFF